ncbi:R3H domain-containing protein 1-like isoform X2 [Corythoichthys intestinalis]|uniref:R3H domain-containing protein 1-like isoform X2 n=1 Tax=Corythoichthys intestinalis TaxID=161448 RepID=UPI0025A55A71|nr:R3H domain-containing protein 1-like isoform X2 [Corythoichthys intestinalis]XP_061802155.1 R3H domain-containing protein 1-like [Nerophis lumbriciformis]
MRMSDQVNFETPKVSVAADNVPCPKDTATQSDVSDEGVKENSGKITAIEAKAVKYSKPKTRLKLVRSLAICEDSFRCPILEPSSAPQDEILLGMLEKDHGATQKQAQTEVISDKVNKMDKMQRKTLSRDSSQDYTDSTGIDLHQFLVNTLKSNPRDRIMLLKLEQDILDFISNNESQKRTFPPMTSYHRMLLHRVAAYFGLDHNVDLTGKSVVINKTTNTRIPDQKFSEHIKDDRTDDFQKRYILKRDNSSFDRDDSTIRMRLKADKKSKSMEEREEEYQRARERIFAHDEDHFILDQSAQDDYVCTRTQQRRQMFRSRAGHSGASWQSSSETETLPRNGEPRPWSSTDSSDSSNRLIPRPAITKASSFSGLSRGDSTASSKSTGRLSKTGSESSSSVGSSSSSLSRPHQPFTVSVSLRPKIPGLPFIHPAADNKGSAHPDMIKSAPSQQTPSADVTNFYVMSLEASSIPHGSILVNPHTGKPFIHTNSNGVVFGPASVAPPAGRGLHQGKVSQLPTSAASQQQHISSLYSQPMCHPFQPSSEPLHNPPVSYQLPPQFLPVCTNQQYTVPETLNTQFNHMTLAQQSPNSGAPATDARHYATLYHHPASVVLHGTPPQQLSNYVVAGPSGSNPGMLQGQTVPLPTLGPHHTYPGSVTVHAAFPGTALNQQHTSMLQQHTYIHQPVQQISACYCSSTHHPQCSSQQQHFRPPLNHLPHNVPQSQSLSQQQVRQPVMSSPAPILGMQPTPNFALSGVQQSNIGSQMQGMMVQYSPIQSCQVSVPQHTGSMLVSPCPPGQGPVAVTGMQPCYGLLPAPNQHTTMSSTVSFLPSPMVEQLQFAQNSSSCVAQANPGLLPAAPGNGMVMLQMSAPPCQQPQASSPCQQKQPSHKHLHPEHPRTRRPTDHPPLPDNMQSSLLSSPPLTPSSGQSHSIKGPPTGIASFPTMARQLPTAFCHSGPGEAQYSVLGQPLEYKPFIQPPLIHTGYVVTKHQGPMGVWHRGYGRKAGKKSFASDHSVVEAAASGPREGTGETDSQNQLPRVCQKGEMTARYTREAPGLNLASLYSTCAVIPTDSAFLNGAPQAHFQPRAHPPRLKEELCGRSSS